MIITIDGPVASGKSSTAKALAKKLGFYYLNTGLMYRALAWLAKNKDLDLNKLSQIPFEYVVEGGQPRILFEGQNITENLFDSEVSKGASVLSQDKVLHHKLIEYQQCFVDKGSLVVEGRDAGTVIFPNADLKIYLTASEEVRAKRWLADPARNNQFKSLEEAIASIQERDKRDKERKVCPLKIAEDAVVVDNSDLSMEAVIYNIIDLF
jgi:CMP/dCMP kinase